ncbi:MAG: hypothetical protein GY765_27165 [bacterium]|nr:hypothetical protein [bacterium]
MVLICKGSFDRNYLLGKIKGVKKFEQLKHGNYTIYSWSKNDFALFADDGLLLYGKTEESLKNTLDVLKRRKKNLASSELMSYVKMIPPDAFLIAASTDISELGKGKGPQGMILGNTGVATFMSMERNKNLALKIMMKSASEDDARNVENVIRGLMALASLKVDEEIKPFLDLLSAVDINRKGAILEIGFEYPSEKLVRLVIDKTKHKKHKHDK